MTNEQLKLIQDLRDQGWGVILWEPEELEGVKVNSVEDACIEAGWSRINFLKDNE
jgi:hypothetical protein